MKQGAGKAWFSQKVICSKIYYFGYYKCPFSARGWGVNAVFVTVTVSSYCEVKGMITSVGYRTKSKTSPDEMTQPRSSYTAY